MGVVFHGLSCFRRYRIALSGVLVIALCIGVIMNRFGNRPVNTLEDGTNRAVRIVVLTKESNHLERNDATRSAIATLRGSGVKSVDLGDCMMTDDLRQALRNSRHLEEVRFPEVSSDDDLEIISAWPKLRRLSLRGSRVCGTRLWHVATAVHLESLDLSGTWITAPGLLDFPQLPSLLELDLSENRLDDTCVAVFDQRRFPRLKTLNISDSFVSDRFVAELSESVSSLEELNLYRTEVTDAAVPFLIRIESLKILGCGLTHMTSDGADSLARARPGLVVDGGG